jgi:DNA polymerase alpha subunit B
MGPFLDRQHPMMSRGQTDKLPDELFNDHVLEPVLDMLSRCTSTKVAFMPSTNDLMSDHMSLPQAPMDLTSLLSKVNKNNDKCLYGMRNNDNYIKA